MKVAFTLTKKHTIIGIVIIVVIIGVLFFLLNGGINLPSTGDGVTDIKSEEQASFEITGFTTEVNEISQKLREINKKLGT